MKTRIRLGAWTLAIASALCASRATAQNYSNTCQSCYIDLGPASLRLPVCLDADEGTPGNTKCQTLVDLGLPLRVNATCAYLGDPCLPTQTIGTYQAFRTWQAVFGFLATPSNSINGDCIDWCEMWGMPEGCT